MASIPVKPAYVLAANLNPEIKLPGSQSIQFDFKEFLRSPNLDTWCKPRSEISIKSSEININWSGVSLIFYWYDNSFQILDKDTFFIAKFGWIIILAIPLATSCRIIYPRTKIALICNFSVIASHSWRKMIYNKLIVNHKNELVFWVLYIIR